MNNQLLIELKQKLSSLESQEKNIAEIVAIKKRNKTIGIVMVIGGILLAMAVSDIPNCSTLQGILVLTAIAGAIFWYLNRKAYPEKKKELDAIADQLLKIKDDIIVAEHS